jgi:hypothetical protein
MAQNTNSAAFLKLKPLQNTNTGALIEEHKRYWTKYKSDKEAKDLARKQNEAEFERKLNKDTFDKYGGLSGIEAKGYFTEQVMSYKKANSEKWLDLSKKALAGDEDSMVLYEQEKEKLKNLIEGSVAVSTKVGELQKQKADGTFNEFRDKELDNFLSQIGKSNYYLDPEQGKYRILDPKNPNVLLEIDPKKLTNDFLSASFNEKISFGDVGSDIADTITLDDVDGSKFITEKTRRDAILKSKQELQANGNLYLSYAKQNNLEKDFDDLSETELNDLAKKYSEEHVLTNLATKDASQLQESRESSLATQRQNRRLKAEEDAKKKEEEEGAGQISVAEGKDDNQLRKSDRIGSKGVSAQPVSTIEDKSKLYNIKGGISNTFTVGNKKTTRTVEQLAVEEDGNIVLLGRELTEVPSKTKFDSNDQPEMETVEKEFQVKGDAKINSFLSGADHDGLPKLLSDIKTAQDEFKKKKGGTDVVDTDNETTKKEISQSDIEAQAKKSGYSVKEYTKLLKENGIKIVN